MLKLATYSAAIFASLSASATGDSERPDLAPLAFIKFCLKEPNDCQQKGRPFVKLDVTNALERKLTSINREVNSRIEPDAYRATYATIQNWELNPPRGDCNDYAVTKRHKLLTAGFPTSAARLAAVKTIAGTDHMVVLVKAKGGDLVLDNLSPKVRRFIETGYRLIKEQSGIDPKLWVKPS